MRKRLVYRTVAALLSGYFLVNGIAQFSGNSVSTVYAAEAGDVSHIPEYQAEVVSDTYVYASPADTGTPVTDVLKEGTAVEVITEVRGAGLFGSFLLVRYGDGGFGYIQGTSARQVDYIGETKVDSTGIATPSFITLSGDIWVNSYSELIRYYMMIPEKVRESFQTDGHTIIMREQDITQEAYADYGGYTGIGTIMAVSDYEKKVIYVQDEYPRQIIHEVGHYVNNKYGFSQKEGFAQLAEAEAKKISIYASSGANEYFAEIFDLYIRDPQALAVISPASFEEIAADMAIALAGN